MKIGDSDLFLDIFKDVADDIFVFNCTSKVMNLSS